MDTVVLCLHCSSTHLFTACIQVTCTSSGFAHHITSAASASAAQRCFNNSTLLQQLNVAPTTRHCSNNSCICRRLCSRCCSRWTSARKPCPTFLRISALPSHASTSLEMMTCWRYATDQHVLPSYLHIVQVIVLADAVVAQA